jgi:mitogen-activated protein kinase kinase
MLLQHEWLAELSKPTTISEEDDLLADKISSLDLDEDNPTDAPTENGFDKEVSEWVIDAIEKKRSGKGGEVPKPALHNAPLDSVSPAASPVAKASG